MKLPVLSVLLLTASLALSATAAEITLPADTSRLRESALPGYAIAQQKCGICHSADYISYQAPGMNQSQWTAEMAKMQHSYGAPISEDEIKLIGAYLAVSYGSASEDDASVVALSESVRQPKSVADDDVEIDVQALLVSNACLGCHAIKNKVVGPSFQDVAARYQGNANSSAQLTESIRSGGSGKWGGVAMPPMSGLTADQAQALAEFVLAQ